MEVILLKDVDKLGLRGDIVDVARGYARNYLLPRQLAEVATKARLAELQRVEANRARHEARSAEQAQGIADVLGKTVLTFEVKAGPTGALFGSVTATDITDEIWRTRKVRIDRRKIGIDPIKRIGRYAIPIEVFQDVSVEVKALVVPEGGELPPEEELAALEAAAAAEEAEHVAEVEAGARRGRDRDRGGHRRGGAGRPEEAGRGPEADGARRGRGEPSTSRRPKRLSRARPRPKQSPNLRQKSRNRLPTRASGPPGAFHSPAHRAVEECKNFPHEAPVSGWKTSPLVFAGRPASGITFEHMFRSPCMGGKPRSAWTSRPRTG